MAKTKVRTHNEYFRTISKNTCPTCKSRKVTVWSWGEYVHGRWNTVMHFCDNCLNREVRPKLLSHAKECGCTFQLVGYCGQRLSESLNALQTTIETMFPACPAT